MSTRKQFKTHADLTIDISGTYLRGYIKTSYENLCDLFGQPGESDGYKTDAEWGIQFEDGVIATIYNWKNGRNYLGKDGLPVSQITDWNVGGNSNLALSRVIELVTLIGEQFQAVQLVNQAEKEKV